MTKKGMSVIAILLIGVLAASCQSGANSPAQGPSGAGAQAGADAPGDLAADFSFSMSAQVDGLTADMAYDQLQSEWEGNFTVDSSGLIDGTGVVVYDAVLFAVNDELCGYSWAEKGEVNYTISGKVHQQGGELFYPLKITLRDPERLTLQGPEATCSDPAGYLKEMPDIYLATHRDALLSTVLTHLHQNVGDQIQTDQELVATSGTVSYQIEVTLEAIPLD